MKIIDLLNKIANGEELPKTIYYRGDVWYLEQKFSNRLAYYKNGYNGDNLLTGKEKDYFSHSLNDEVEILEEKKKIPEKLIPTSLKGIDNLNEKIEIAHIDTISVIETLNQLIDYFKSKGDE